MPNSFNCLKPLKYFYLKQINKRKICSIRNQKNKIALSNSVINEVVLKMLIQATLYQRCKYILDSFGVLARELQNDCYNRTSDIIENIANEVFCI